MKMVSNFSTRGGAGVISKAIFEFGVVKFDCYFVDFRNMEICTKRMWFEVHGGAFVTSQRIIVQNNCI